MGEAEAGPEAPQAVDPLLTWSLSTFHATLFVVVGVLLLHLAGGVGGVLAEVGTGAGVTLFLALWAITWWTNRRLLEDVGGLQDGPLDAMGRVVERSLVWGGATGALFLWALIASLVVREALQGGLGGDGLLFVAGVVGFGGLATFFAFLFGALLGAVLAVVDALLMEAARRAVRPGGGDGDAAADRGEKGPKGTA